MKRYILSALLAVGLLMPTASPQQTKVLTADKHNEYGLVYTLPLTGIRIDVTATRTIRKAGPFYQYAKKYIGTDKVVKEDSETWTIGDIKVSRYGVPDPDQRYLMQLKPGATTYIGVSDDGMLLSINKEPEQRQGSQTSVAAAPMKAFTGKEYLQYVNEDFIASQSSAKKAQLLSESLMEVRDAKVSLSRGTAETMPTDGRQLELMLASLARQEKALTEAFVGSEQTDTFTSSYTFMPEKEGRTVLFRLSDFGGFRDSTDYSGDPVYITISDIAEAELPKDPSGEYKKLPKDAVIYAIPVSAKVSVSFAGKNLYSETMDFAQFGTTFGLNPNLFTSKKEPSYATFDPLTGALVEIGSATAQ